MRDLVDNPESIALIEPFYDGPNDDEMVRSPHYSLAIRTPATLFERPPELIHGPDRLGQYILYFGQDACYENVAALGAEYTDWTLVSEDGVGRPKSIWLERLDRSRPGREPLSREALDRFVASPL